MSERLTEQKNNVHPFENALLKLAVDAQVHVGLDFTDDAHTATFTTMLLFGAYNEVVLGGLVKNSDYFVPALDAIFALTGWISRRNKGPKLANYDPIIE